MTATAPPPVAASTSEVGGRQLAAWQSLAGRLQAVADPTRTKSGSRTDYQLATTELGTLAGDLLTPLAQPPTDQPPPATPQPVNGRPCRTRSGEPDPAGSAEVVGTCRVGREARCPSCC